MIQSFRKASQSWAMRIFFAVLVFALVILWGVGDYFDIGGMGSQYAAIVGNKKVSISEFNHKLRIISQKFQRQGGELPNEISLRQAALGNLVQETLLDIEADRLGVAISDQQLRDIILTLPQYKDQTGQYNKDLFEAYAREEGRTVKEYSEGIRQQLRREQMLSVVSSGLQFPACYVERLFLWQEAICQQLRREQMLSVVSSGLQFPASYVERLFRWQNERRVVDWLEIKDVEQKDVEQPTVQQKEGYYNENKALFVIPEKRDVTALIMSADILEKNITLTDEQIQQVLLDRQDQLGGGIPTQAQVDKIIAEVKKEQAKELMFRLEREIGDNVSAGVPLEEIAQQNNLQLLTAKGLQQNGAAEEIGPISLNAVLALIEDGFNQAVGDDSSFRTLENNVENNEYIAVRVDGISASRQQEFGEVEEEVTKLIYAERQMKAAKARAEQIKEQLNQGEPIAKIAKENNLKLNSNITLARDASDKAEASRYLRGIAFATTIGKADLTRNLGGYVVVMPVKIEELDLSNRMDEVKVFSDLLFGNLRNDLLTEYMVSLEKRYKVEENKNLFIVKDNDG